MALSLYVHIPFCLKRCIYCDFISGIYDPEKADAYIEALKKELLNIPEKTQISTLYIGGGTPTALSTNALSDLIHHIFNNFNFVKNCEATIEANPGTLDTEKLNALLSLRINRISVGVQSFDDEELRFLGRIHNKEEAEQAVSLAREAGFDNIGIDLIYGIPGQNNDSWEKTLENAVKLEPEHISTYELTVEKGTALYEYLKKDQLIHPHPNPVPERFRANPPPSRGRGCLCSPSPGGRGLGGGVRKLNPLDEEKIIEMYDHAIEYLTSKGFIHYEISNFALPDYFCRHNLNYWDRGEYYGVGLAAHSFINRNRFYNTDNLNDYINAFSEDKRYVKDTEYITDDMALTEAIFLGLRKTRGINLKIFSEIYKRDLLSFYKKEIEELQEAGLITISSSSSSNNSSHLSHSKVNYLRLTRKGLLLSNEVFERFI